MSILETHIRSKDALIVIFGASHQFLTLTNFRFYLKPLIVLIRLFLAKVYVKNY